MAAETSVETSPFFSCPSECNPQLVAEVEGYKEPSQPQRMVYRYYEGRHGSHLGPRSREFWSKQGQRDETEVRVYQRLIGDQWIDLIQEQGIDKTNITPLIRATA